VESDPAVAVAAEIDRVEVQLAAIVAVGGDAERPAGKRSGGSVSDQTYQSR
jgi:hypothetical protein